MQRRFLADRHIPMDDIIISIERPVATLSRPTGDSVPGQTDTSVDPGAQQEDRTRRLWLTGLVGVFALMAIAVLTLTSEQAPIDGDGVETVPSSTERPPALSVAVFDAIAPSVVTIFTSSTSDVAATAGGLGTGVIINDAGLILTSLHVVDGADAVQVRFADGTATTASVVDADPSNDIAVLSPDSLPTLLVPAVLGTSSAPRIGDEAFVVGNPLGLTRSMSAGVISGLGRSFQAPDSDVVLDGLIQFDASANPGNSGGPLLNRRGEVIGVVTALANPTGDESFSGIGFAVTIESARGGLGPGQ